MTSAKDLCAFVDASPSPYHAVSEMARRLEVAGFTRLDEGSRWDSLAPGDCRYVVRDGGTIAAFRVGDRSPVDAGFRLAGAHTDSPTLKVRPRAEVSRSGYRLVGVEVYGSPLLHTWVDRDLALAGRVALLDDGDGDGTRRPGWDGIEMRQLRTTGAWLRIPSLAIHLDRDVATQGIKLDRQRHVVPVWGPESAEDLMDAVADHLNVERARIAGIDLVTADTQPSAVGGAGDSYVFAPRLDNLGSCHAATSALVDAQRADATQVLIANDHEEVGSGSAEGARGPFLEDVLRRIVAAIDGPDPQSFPRAASRSVLVSADMAHAVHPNYADRHEPGHAPVLGGGPVIKHNAGQSYATDAASAAWFVASCREAGVDVQHFVTRGDLPCGSTIGPLTATRLGLQTVDVGNPTLSMHSCREQAAAADVPAMIAALGAHFVRA